MATLAFAATGALIGGWIGGWTTTALAIGWAAGLAIGQAVVPPSGFNVRQEGPRLNDRSVQSSSPGVPIPRVWGRVRMAGNIIWAPPLKEVRTETTTRTSTKGKKKSSSTTVTYQYFTDCAIAFGHGPIFRYLKVLADGKPLLEWDQITQTYIGRYTEYIRFYLGTETQTPDPLMESIDGVGNVPGYRGIFYIVLLDFPLADFGNRIPQIHVIVQTHDDTQTIDLEHADLTANQIAVGDGGAEFYSGRDRGRHGRIVLYNGEFWLAGYRNFWKVRQSDMAITFAGAPNTDDIYGHFYEFNGANWVQTTLADDMEGIQFFWEGPDPDGMIWATYGHLEDWWLFSVLMIEASTLKVKAQLRGRWSTGGGVLPDVADYNTYPTAATGQTGVFHLWYNPTGDPGDQLKWVILLDSLNADSFVWIDRRQDPLTMGVDEGRWPPGSTGEVAMPYAANDFLQFRAIKGKEGSGRLWIVGNAAFGTIFKHAPHITWIDCTQDPPEWAPDFIDLLPIVEPFGTWNFLTHSDLFLICYDQENDRILLAWEYQQIGPSPLQVDMLLIAFDCASEQVVWTRPIKAGVDGWPTNMFAFGGAAINGVSCGKFWIVRNTGSSSTGWLCEVSAIDGSLLRTWDLRTFAEPPNPTFQDPPPDGTIDVVNGFNHSRHYFWFDETADKLYIGGNRYDLTPATDGEEYRTGLVSVDINLQSGVSLGQVVADISSLSDLTPAQIDRSKFNATPFTGGMLGRVMNGRTALETVLGPYFGIGVESDAKIKFKFRNEPPVLTIDANHLGMMAPQRDGSSKPVPRIVEKRTAELELKSRIVLLYSSPSQDYLVGNQSEKRQTPATLSDDRWYVDVPLTFTDAEAKERAQKLLYLSHIEREGYSFPLPRKYLALDAGDTINFPLPDGETIALMLTKVDYGADGLLDCSSVRTDPEVYEGAGDCGIPIPRNITRPTAVQTMTLYLLDLPLLRAEDDTYGHYAAARGQTNAWDGGTAYRSIDNSDYTPIVDFAIPVMSGVAQTALANHNYLIIDVTNTVRIALHDTKQVILSVDPSQMFAAGRVLALKNGVTGLYEMIFFATATQVQAGVYDISHMARGQMGTEHSTSGHATNDLAFILQEDGGTLPVEITPEENNQLRYYKGVSNFQTLDDVTEQTFTPTSVRIKPLAPVNIAGVRDGSNNLTITWDARIRGFADIVDGVDTVLDEPIERYKIEVYNGVNIVRTITVDDIREYEYTATDQTTDFGSPQASVTVKIYQWSTRVGWGYAGTATI